MTTVILIVLIFGFIITWIVCSVSSTPSEFMPRLEEINLRSENFALKDKIRDLNYQLRHYKNNEYYAKFHCCKCQPEVYMPTIKEQELADIITKSQKSVAQLAKDLKI